MKAILFLTIIIIPWFHSLANSSHQYISTTKGITIIYTGGANDTTAQQKELDEFLQFIVQKVYPQDSDLKILLLLGAFGIHRPEKDFIGISYENFCKADTIFIDKNSIGNYKSLYNLSNNKNWILNEMYPINVIKLLYNCSENPIGLKIRFYGESDSTKNYYTKILSLLDYALKNKNKVKMEQQVIKMNYILAGMTISILTFDTTKLNAINSNNVHYKESNSLMSNFIFTTIFALVFIVGLTSLLWTRLKHNR